MAATAVGAYRSWQNSKGADGFFGPISDLFARTWSRLLRRAPVVQGTVR